MPLWALKVYVYERGVGPDFPVVAHFFYGRTRDQAEGFFRSHLTTDKFLRDCVERQRWQDVDCWAEFEWTRDGAPRATTRPFR